MQNAQLKKMPAVELARLRDQIDAILDQKVSAERRELQSKMDALAALAPPTGRRSKPKRGGHGVQLAKANSRLKAHPLRGRKAPPIFRGPNGETWAGRGLTPRWLVALEKKGKKRESYRVAV